MRLISNQSGHLNEWGVSENLGIKGLEFVPKRQMKLTSFETCFSPSVSQTLKVWIQKYNTLPVDRWQQVKSMSELCMSLLPLIKSFINWLVLKGPRQDKNGLSEIISAKMDDSHWVVQVNPCQFIGQFTLRSVESRSVIVNRVIRKPVKVSIKLKPKLELIYEY